MNKQQALALLELPADASKAEIGEAYRQKIFLAEDAVDDARTAAEENQAWDHLKQIQQARSFLLKALTAPTVEESQVQTFEAAPPKHTPATEIDEAKALALLDLASDASLDDIQRAYQAQIERLDAAIDQTSNPVQAEPLWEQHKHIQQARYLLLHTQGTRSNAETNSTLTKKQRHALAVLQVQEDASADELRRAYNQKVYAIEDAIADAKTQQEEQQRQDELRELQRAFSVANHLFSSVGESKEEAKAEVISPSPHRQATNVASDSVEDFLKKQQRAQWLKRVLYILLLACALAGGFYAWQHGYIQQFKDWLIPPPSPEELAAQQQVLKLQEEVQAQRDAIEASYEQVREKAFAAANADSPDYPRLVRLREKLNKQVLSSTDFIKAKQLQETAQTAIEQSRFLDAESPLLDARGRYHRSQKTVAAMTSGKKPAPVKRYIPKPVVTKPKKEQIITAPALPVLNSAQKALLPIMLDIKPGTYSMGNSGGKYDNAQEQPIHKVTLSLFKLGRDEVTVDHFKQFVQQTNYKTEAEKHIDQKGCSVFDEETKSWQWQQDKNWKNPGFKQSGQDPVVCVSWADVQAYLAWLRKATAWPVRLPSEAEWEYAARAGTETQWYWGDQLIMERANCEECNQDWEIRRTFPSNKYPANAWGLYGMAGNAWEWTQDCWRDSYASAANDGSPQRSGDCNRRVLRGGSWYSPARELRSAARSASHRLSYRSSSLGFRIAVTP